MKKHKLLIVSLLAAGTLTAGLLLHQHFSVSFPNNPQKTASLSKTNPTPNSPTSLASISSPPTATIPPTVTSLAIIEPTSFPTPALPALEKEVIGLSLEGRPLVVYRFGNGPLEQMIVAGIHGGYEWNTVVLADQLIDFLKNNPGAVPDDRSLYILRVFNPDGYARSTGVNGRANSRNVDLNRNFPHNWRSEWPLAGCWSYQPINGGTEPVSEPETSALINFINNHQIDSLISYHSAALGIFPGGQPLDTNSLSLAESIAEISPYPYPPIDLGCLYTGQLIDWASDQGIAAVDIELTNHQDSDFEINLAVLSTFLSWERVDD